MRGRIGGILALKTDFELLEDILRELIFLRELGMLSEEVSQSFKDIFKAGQPSWTWMVDVSVLSMQPSGNVQKVLRSGRCLFDKYGKVHTETVFFICEHVLPGAAQRADRGKLCWKV